MAVEFGVGLLTGRLPPGSDRTFRQEYRDIVSMVRLTEVAPRPAQPAAPT